MSVQAKLSREADTQQPVLVAGQPLDRARTAMVLLHGRGGSAEGMLSLADELGHSHTVYLAPQAEGHSWYPYSFLAPIDRNEPYLSAALTSVSAVFDRLKEAGISPKRTILLGFSQGACLALEYAARHARRYGGVVGLSGGLIGPEGTPRDYAGSLASTPVFLGCSDVDPHIPKDRVLESADVLRHMGARVTMRLYPGMGHTVTSDELDAVRGMLQGLPAG
jgi:predicted esterase